MAFFEELFPARISQDAEGGPRFITSKAYSAAGQRIANREATYPLHEYSIAHPPRSQEDFEALRAFFYVVGGDADAFRFKDWSDFRATQENSNLTRIAGDQFQLNRLYIFGTRTFVRPISKPMNGVIVWRNHGGVWSQASAVVNTATGRVTVSGHSDGDIYVWEGMFHVPVAFKDPSAVWKVLGGPRMITEWAGIELEEVRL
ncbi:DUF2460 domain-containing protein [Comamonas sp.]|uniref:DUF2460 domain-containing protein n=1 Tax=Comamonas sp. TaxID=34028 RepID=UPI003A90B00D